MDPQGDGIPSCPEIPRRTTTIHSLASSAAVNIMNACADSRAVDPIATSPSSPSSGRAPTSIPAPRTQPLLLVPGQRHRPLTDARREATQDADAQDWASNTTGMNASLRCCSPGRSPSAPHHQEQVHLEDRRRPRLSSSSSTTWIIGWSTGAQYSELEAAERQYWFFWKTAQCNITDMADCIARSMDVEPLHAMNTPTTAR